MHSDESRNTRTHRSWHAKLKRRTISIPGIFLASAIWLITLPLWLPIGLLVDLCSVGWHERPRIRALFFFGLYFGCEVMGVLAAALVWLLLLGGWVGGEERFIEWNAILQRWWSRWMRRGSFRIFSMKLEVSGLEHARTGPYLLFVRHSSAADTVLAADIVANPRKRLLRYVLKKELLWDPCLDIVGCRLPNVFVDRKAENPGTEVATVGALAKGLDENSGVLIYPEGTRYSPGKLRRAVEKIEEKGWRDLAEIARSYQSVLPPRLAGPLALIENAPELDVVILAHTGFEGAATFSSFWRGRLIHRIVQVRIRRIPAQEIPAEGRERWLFEQWASLDRWVTKQAKVP